MYTYIHTYIQCYKTYVGGGDMRLYQRFKR